MLDLNVAILHPSERLKSLPKHRDAGLYFRIVLRERMQEHDARRTRSVTQRLGAKKDVHVHS